MVRALALDLLVYPANLSTPISPLSGFNFPLRPRYTGHDSCFMFILFVVHGSSVRARDLCPFVPLARSPVPRMVPGT